MHNSFEMCVSTNILQMFRFYIIMMHAQKDSRLNEHGDGRPPSQISHTMAANNVPT
jgi:hypothetical protein